MREWNSKMISRANYSIDMCHGPLLGKIVRFVIPLMAANMMQCLFSAVDLIVIGRYASADAMAAVGSSGPLISAILSVFFGLSVGGNVLVARYIGAKDQERLFRTVHTVIAIALYGGVLLATAGWIVSRPVLELTQPPPEVLHHVGGHERDDEAHDLAQERSVAHVDAVIGAADHFGIPRTAERPSEIWSYGSRTSRSAGSDLREGIIYTTGFEKSTGEGILKKVQELFISCGSNRRRSAWPRCP